MQIFSRWVLVVSIHNFATTSTTNRVHVTLAVLLVLARSHAPHPGRFPPARSRDACNHVRTVAYISRWTNECLKLVDPFNHSVHRLLSRVDAMLFLLREDSYTMVDPLKDGKSVPRTAWQWGFSCEFLKVQDILDLGVPELMAEYDFGLFLKMYEEDFDDTYETLCHRLKELGIHDHFYPWPCLAVEKGYYPNINTVEAFTALMKRIMHWYTARGVPLPDYFLVDLEPDIDPARFEEAERLRAENRLLFRDDDGNITVPEVDGKDVLAKGREDKPRNGQATRENKEGTDWMKLAGKLIDSIDEMDDARFMEASRKFQDLVDMMHERGTKALCVALPLTFDDLKDGKHLLQDFFTTPIHTVEWDMINYMIFTTPTRNLFDHDDYVHLCYSYCKSWHEMHGDRASVCFGITGFGRKLAQIDPGLYLEEFNAALATGVTKLGIFALENILMLGEAKCRKFLETVNAADGSFTPDPEKLEFARLVRDFWEGVDAFIAPLLIRIVKSGRAMEIIQKLAKGLF
ncbi:hypothetical protein GF325_03980 [Candidatus Bathyarchaeota archaeon]|nr:hypothetical protein [Candidatus Bathyarchaeota archaeon]